MITDKSGKQVKAECGNGCGEVRAVLKRSSLASVQPTPGQEHHEYAGHVAICPDCGYECKDFYNWEAV